VLRASELLNTTEPSALAVVLVLSVFFIGMSWIVWQVALHRPGRERRMVLAAGFAALLAAMPIVSSITWQHHLVTELLVFALIAPALLRTTSSKSPLINPARWLACISYPLLWVDRHVTDQLVLLIHLDGPTGWKVWPFLLITRTTLVGMICLWLACMFALATLAASGETKQDDAIAVIDGDQ
jgi:hypothetical protein